MEEKKDTDLKKNKNKVKIKLLLSQKWIKQCNVDRSYNNSCSNKISQILFIGSIENEYIGKVPSPIFDIPIVNRLVDGIANRKSEIQGEIQQQIPILWENMQQVDGSIGNLHHNNYGITYLELL
ncbi:hypothetical protein pb186bvf_019103 [Paramecium bursaria]